METVISIAIREARKAEGLTQQSLAVLAGVHICTVIRWEQWSKTPKIENLKKIADALQRTLLLQYNSEKKVLSVSFPVPENVRLITLDERISSKPIQDKLLSVCVVLCNYNRDNANDLCQETTVTALLNGHRYDSTKCQLITWLVGIAKNIRARELKGLHKLTYIENYIESLSDDDWLEVPAVSRLVLNRTPKRRLQMYQLRLMGYSYPEIGRQMGLSGKYVKSRFCELRKELVNSLKN